MILTAVSCLAALLSTYITGEVLLSFVAGRRYSTGVVFLAGLSVWALIANALLVADIFAYTYIFLLVAIAWLLFIWIKREALGSLPARIQNARFHVNWRGYNSALLLCVCLVSVIFGALNFVPLSTTDGAAYHVPFARDFILSHRINQPIAASIISGDAIKFHYGYLPALGEVMFATVTLMSGLPSMAPPIIALQLAVFVALLISLYAETKSFITRSSARSIILLLLLVTPVFRDSVMFVGMIDLLLGAFIVVGVLLLLRGCKEGESSDLYIGALFLGTAMAIKYLAIIAVVYCGILLLASLMRIIAPSVRWRQVLIASAIVIAAPAYWYIKNFILFHNPVYPIFSGQAIDAAIQSVRYLPQAFWFKAIYPVGVYMTFIFAKSTVAHLAIVQFLIAAGSVGGAVILFVKTRRIDFYTATLLGFPLFYSWVVSFVSDDIRYNFAALIVFAVLDGLLLDRYLDWWGPRAERVVAYASILVVVVLVPLMLHSPAYAEKILVLRGAMSTETYINTQTPEHSVVKYDALMDIR